ncbi:aminotransferase class I and II-domain-containing protein, partial [Flagelloscypha sp. PMI_526]
MRVCVAPGREKIITTPPTYGMYAVCAQVNDVGVVKVPLELTGDNGEGGTKGRFSVRINEVKKAIEADPTIKLIFMCSPGNPTGTLIPLSTIKELLDFEPFKGIVVVDEAYIDFAGQEASACSLVHEYSNICVMQTLSKSFGLAAILHLRVGIAIAQPPLIQILTNTKAPYNISAPAASLALAALTPEGLSLMHQKSQTLVAERETLIKHLQAPPLTSLGVGPIIGANDANFVVVRILSKEGGEPDSVRAEKAYKKLAEENGVVVRFRGKEPGCEGALRITVGATEETQMLIRQLRKVLG